MIIAATLLAVLTISPRIEIPVLPAWLNLNLHPANDKYQRILEEVRPAYGKDGLIDHARVESEFERAAETYMRNRENPELLMWAIAWWEVLQSDRFDAPTDYRGGDGHSFFVAASRFDSRVDSFAYVRTRVMAGLGSREVLSHFEVLPKLYAASPDDTELELEYLRWAANANYADRDSLVALAEKQEKLEFRRVARLRDLASIYHSLAHKPPRRRDLLDKGYELSARYYQLLPKGHPLNTAEERREQAGYLKETYDRWAAWEGR